MLRKIEVIAEHSDWLVINKPADWSVQDDQHGLGVLNTLKQIRSEPELALVHRLDKVTSGLLLIGRNHRATSYLSQQFAARTVVKYYVAIAEGKPAKKQGTVLGDMVKSRRGGWKLLRSKANPAITQFFSQSHSAGKRWYLLKPTTGKTHQLRVALKSLGSPILGDQAYGANEAGRVYLHAYALSFDWQGAQQFILPPPLEGSFNQPLPEDWREPNVLIWPRLSSQ